jgi:hypothetical protein
MAPRPKQPKTSIYIAEIPETWFFTRSQLVSYVSEIVMRRRRLTGVDVALGSVFDSTVMCGFSMLDESKLQLLDCQSLFRYLKLDKTLPRLPDPASIVGADADLTTVQFLGVTFLSDLYALLLVHELCVRVGAHLVMNDMCYALHKEFEAREVGTMSELTLRKQALSSTLSAREKDPMFVSELSDMLARARKVRQDRLVDAVVLAVRKTCEASKAGDDAAWFAKAGWIPNMAPTLVKQALRVTATRVRARLAENGQWTADTDHDTEATRREDFEDALDVGVKWFVHELNEITAVAIEGYDQG